MSNKKKTKAKTVKTKGKQSLKTPHMNTHSHPHPTMQFDTLNICDKEDCGVQLEPGQALCDRHDFAIRAIVGRYLMPSLAEENWAELLSKATAMGYHVPWKDIAMVREVSHPEGWSCSFCGGGMTPLIKQDDAVVQWEHACDPEAMRHWEERKAKELLEAGGEGVVVLGEEEGSVTCLHVERVWSGNEEDMAVCAECGMEVPARSDDSITHVQGET